MSAAYHQLLDATIRHLEELKSRGVRLVAVAPDTLRALAQPVRRTAVTAAPARPAPLAPVAPSRPMPAPAAVAPPAPVRPVVAPAPSIPLAAPKPSPVPKPAPPSAPLAAPATSPVVTAAPPAPAVAKRLTPAEKAAGMAALRESTLVCIKCPHLAASRHTAGLGVGDINARLMFVGEAPGADEDRQGDPFVGAAGQLLTKIILATGLSRETVYIANILKCRPDTPGQSTGNRKPTPEEMTTCLPWLLQQIDLIQPQVMVALGVTAVEGLLGKTIGITKLRANWQSYRGIPLMPTYHPSYMLHNQAVSEKRKVWEDMLQVMERLEMPISDKQRNFFLKG
jgi:uracil-DNA glycosylase family 4